MILSISLSVYRNDLKTIKKQYKNSQNSFILRNDMILKKIMYATINVLNSGFFCTTGMQHEKYLFYKVLSYRCNKKGGEEF